MKRWKVKGFAPAPVDVVLFGDEEEVRAHLGLPKDAPIGPGELAQAARRESYGGEPLEIVDVQQANFLHATSFDPEDVHFDPDGQDGFVISEEEVVECMFCGDWIVVKTAHRHRMEDGADGWIGDECDCWDERLRTTE